LTPDRAEEKVERPILNLRHNVMKITIQYFDGCPHWNFAQKRLKKVLRDVGRDDVEVDLEVIDSPEAAERARFRGSPTFLFDGRDPFANDDQSFGLSCRVYDTEEGLQGAPTETQLRALLMPRPMP
jgi:hypothetical protein